jgi:hypothetical protein
MLCIEGGKKIEIKTRVFPSLPHYYVVVILTNVSISSTAVCNQSKVFYEVKCECHRWRKR